MPVDTALAAVAAASLLLAVGLIVWAIAVRRRLVRDARLVVRAVEALREGGERADTGVSDDSPLALVADALDRLGGDVGARLEAAVATSGKTRALLEAMSDRAVVTTDTDGDVTSFSEGAAAVFGWKSDEIVRRPASLLFDEDAYRQFLPKLARRAMREQGVRSRSTMRRGDGSEFVADLNVRLLRDNGGDSAGFLILVADATEPVRLERDLQRSEQRYRGLVDGLSDGVAVARAGQLIQANPAFARLCGIPVERLIGTPVRDRIDTRDVLCVEETLAELEAATGGSREFRCGLLGDASAPSTLVRVGATGIVDDSGHPSVLLLVRDETVERRVQDELKRNESQLDAVLESASDGLLVLVNGKDGGLVKMTNGAFCTLFGLRRDDVLGSTGQGLIRRLRELGGGAAALAEFLGKAGRGRTTGSIALRGETPGVIEVTLATLTDRGGMRIGRVLACRDRSEQQAAEGKLQEHAERLQLSKVMLEQAYERLNEVNAALGARGEQLDALNDELRTLDEMKSNLLGNVSHELQTPLVSIRGYTEMILKERLGPVSDEQRKGLTLCLRNIDRLISMIDNLLVFSRTEPEIGQPKLTLFSLSGLVDEAATLLNEKIAARALRFSTEFPDGDLEVRADRDKIQQVLINLLSNAVKFNRQGGAIVVTARAADAGVASVRVEDTGEGIPADALERIFDRHYRAGGPSPGGPQGSGIGLAIVRDILRLHGCAIDVESREGHGARFTFTLPLAERIEIEENGGVSDPAAEVDPVGQTIAPDRSAKARLRIIRRTDPDS